MMRYLLLLVPGLLAAGPARYARIGESAGTVEAQARASDGWVAAERNLPLPEGAWVRTGEASRLEIELDDGSVARLGPNTQLGLADYSRLSTGQRVTLLWLDRGLAYVTGRPEGRDALTVAVPGAQVTFTRGGRMRLEVEEQWSQIALLGGAARFSSPAADLELREGQTTRVEPANAARFFYYKEVLPVELDQWNEERDEALRSSPSAAHTVQRYGLADLDTGGEWIVTTDLGVVWRPKVAEEWLPFQKGRWRWMDGLGYTWISDDPWGWLPYHYGRWTRLDNLGWVWAPSKNGIFKPGDVYWVRGAGLAGWGPLAPGEQWEPLDLVNPLPQQFLDVNTTYAAWRTGAAAIDPAGFTSRPKDPLKSVEFTAALPSPAFLAGRLDAVRPQLDAAALRVRPVVDGVTADTAPRAPSYQPLLAPAAQPVVIVTQAAAAPAPPPEPEVIAVPVPAGIVFLTAPSQHRDAIKPAIAARPVAPQQLPPGRRERSGRAPAKKFHNAAEATLANTIVQELDARSFKQAAADLDLWSDRFHDSEYADERVYYYMLAYNGLSQPAKVVDIAARLMQKPVAETFDDAMQALSVLYLTVTNFQKMNRPTRDQLTTTRTAAREMLSILPECFTPEHRPAVMSATDWARSRGDLEQLGREMLARAGR